MRSIKLVFLILASLVIILACGLSNPQTQDTANEQIQEMQATIAALEDQLAAVVEPAAVGTENSPAENENPPTAVMPTAESLPTAVVPTAESLPTEPVPAGMPIRFDGWSITVSQELMLNTYYDTWGLEIFVRNLGETKRVFRFTNSAITIRDNLGNTYAPSGAGSGSGDPCEAVYFEVKNVEIDGQESLSIVSESLGYNACNKNRGIPMFEGPIPLDVSELIIHFENFGPFSNVDVILDL